MAIISHLHLQYLFRQEYNITKFSSTINYPIMKVTSSVVFWLFASAAALSVKQRQDGPVDPNTDPDCDWYDTPRSKSDTCEFIEEFWGIPHAEFVAWVCIIYSFFRFDRSDAM